MDLGILDSLAQDFRVIALDLRGHGRSGKPHDPSAYGRQVLEDIVGLMDELGLESADVVGYSTGAQVGLSLVTEFPERVGRAVLGGGGMLEVGGEEYEWYRAIPDALSGFGPDDTIVDRLFPGGGFDGPLADAVNANDPLAISAFARGMLDLVHDEESLRDNQVPVLLFVGEDDVSKYQADAALQVGNNMRMHVLPGRDHVGAMRDPEFVSSIRGFLASG
jgi:pimeloyl-ACP methyl ester carboxylesterase